MALAVLVGQEYTLLIDRDGLSPLEDTGRRWPLTGTMGWWEEPRGYDSNGELFTAPLDALRSVDRKVESKRLTVDFPKPPERRQTPGRRLSPREPIAKIIVMIRRSRDSESPDCAGNGVDISDSGMAVVLPLNLAAGSRVYLDFKLGDAAFSRVPAEIVRQDNAGISAVRFVDWSDSQQLELASYLQKTQTMDLVETMEEQQERIAALLRRIAELELRDGS